MLKQEMDRKTKQKFNEILPKIEMEAGVYSQQSENQGYKYQSRQEPST